MKIKTKLALGLVFLFAALLLLTTIGTYYIHRLSDDIKRISKDNYESLVYTKNMLQALDEISIDHRSSVVKFETNLKAQEKNITEGGEKEATIELRNQYKNLKLDSLKETEKNLLRQKLHVILNMNLQAINRKNTEANASAYNAVVYISIIGAITILIAFSFIVNFPGYIANPIRELTEGIKEISKKN